MPDIKEKLMELAKGAFDKCLSVVCAEGCEYYDKDAKATDRTCQHKLFADHLIAHGVTIQQWISVEERLPEPNRRVMVNYSGGIIEVGFWLSTSEHFTLEHLHGEATIGCPCRSRRRENDYEQI